MELSDVVQPLMIGGIANIAREESHAAYVRTLMERSADGRPFDEREEQRVFDAEQRGYRSLYHVDAMSWLIEVSGTFLSAVGMLAHCYGHGEVKNIWQPGLAAAGAALFRHGVFYLEQRALKQHNERIAELRLYNEQLPI
jgi:hypothetical protein